MFESSVLDQAFIRLQNLFLHLVVEYFKLALLLDICITNSKKFVN
jgi:hypothetical protein